MGNSAIPNQVQDVLSSNQSEPNITDENRFEQWGSAASTTANLLLHRVKESTDTFPPLKSVVGTLCFFVDNCEVCYSFGIHFP